MTMQTIPLESLMPPAENPRTAMDAQALSGLAESVKADGLLQNLVVRPVKGKGSRYRIISGARRYSALRLLAEQGEIANDYPVPVEIRTGLSKDDTLRIATVENVQRENLSPLDEAAAFARLVHKGARLDEIAAQTGVSPRTIKRRLALNALCDQAKQALAGGEITLAQAEALTLGSAEDQRRVLEYIGPHSDAEDIRETLTGGKPAVAMAIFPVAQYEGTFTTDLFADEDTTYFDDAEQFFALQEKAVQALAESHRESAAWVEVTNEYRLPHWLFGEAEEGQPGGVLINLAPSGRVEIREGLVRPEKQEDSVAELAENPAAPKKPKASYAAPLRRYIAWHKSMAVQEVLMADPRKAKEVAAVRLLMDLKPHPCLTGLSRLADPQVAYEAVEAQAKRYAEMLGLESTGDGPGWETLACGYHNDVTLYEGIKALSDRDLDALLTLITVLSFGQSDCEWLDADESLFNHVAQDLGVDMRSHWKPDHDFLSRRTKDQLVAVAKESGYAEGASLVARYTKSELVASLLRHFGNAHSAADPTEAQQKARGWLPEAMNFPAIDPDAQADAGPQEPDEAA